MPPPGTAFVKQSGRDCATDDDDFNLHAAVSVPGGALYRERLEHLCRYVARPAIASERPSELPDGRIAYDLRRPWSDGRLRGNLPASPHGGGPGVRPAAARAQPFWRVGARSTSSSSSFRRRISPRRTCVLTVPSGRPVASATAEWVWPMSTASRMTRR